ncbi:MAG: glycosyltransferase family 25 protein [Gammaproteobacteria bacterium]|nr:glycosyltransferase family 25 protein [Gammaproteobacteria bacterium]
MRIFVINLPESKERRASARAQLDYLDLTFEFFAAVRGEAALAKHFAGYDERQFLLNTGRAATTGEIGCYASHLALWKKSIELNQSIMVMEDDFLLDDRFAEAVRLVAENIDELGYIRLQSETRARKCLYKQLGDFQLWRYTRFPNSAMCYGISPAVSRTLVASSAQVTAPIDVHVKKFWEHGHVMYGISPYTVTESPAASHTTISGRQKARKSLKLRVLRPVTKLNWLVKRNHFNRRVAGRNQTR